MRENQHILLINRKLTYIMFTGVESESKVSSATASILFLEFYHIAYRQDVLNVGNTNGKICFCTRCFDLELNQIRYM